MSYERVHELELAPRFLDLSFEQQLLDAHALLHRLEVHVRCSHSHQCGCQMMCSRLDTHVFSTTYALCWSRARTPRRRRGSLCRRGSPSPSGSSTCRSRHASSVSACTLQSLVHSCLHLHKQHIQQRTLSRCACVAASSSCHCGASCAFVSCRCCCCDCLLRIATQAAMQTAARASCATPHCCCCCCSVCSCCFCSRVLIASLASSRSPVPATCNLSFEFASNDVSHQNTILTSHTLFK